MQKLLLSCQSGKELKKSSLKKFPAKIRTNLSVAAKVKSQVYRGVIQSYDSETQICKVKLVDFGRVADVSVEDLSVLPTILRQTNQFCICVRLIGIRPTGPGKEWTFSAIDRLSNLVNGKRLFVKSCVRLFFFFYFDLKLAEIKCSYLGLAQI